ncbi:UNVERIFIED_CONTAM: hypothetical protein Scaly_1607400 [Sesamum calycinum]|uniref:Retrotransposon gag protein n=1 Tax=Sesamum calycinum TaxID=2727403 RepID=A0AAW2P7E7_9LAMI
MTSLDLNQQSLCIEYLILHVDFELKSGLIHLLPTFRGLAGLSEANRSLVDAASGGALYDKTPTEARKLITTMAANNQQFGSKNDNPSRTINEDTQASIQNLESQVSQLASSVSRLESQEQGKTGEKLEIPPKQVEKSNLTHEEHPKVFVSKPPFPDRFAKSKMEEEEKEILETLCKVEVNISLLDAIKQVPRYAKFLKELCTNKFKLRGNERVSMGKNVSAILQRKLPHKGKDPATPTSPLPSPRRRGLHLNLRHPPSP